MIFKIEFDIISIKTLFEIIIFFLLTTKKNVINIKNANKITEYQKNIDFSDFKTNIKAIALYLPQFHEIKENNKFWGKGFTEWTNVKKCQQRYKGHHQPRSPGDIYGYLNYYDLSDVRAIEKQIKLAKSHGIFGFGIYYYWFSGKELLETPIYLFMKYIRINFHFLLIWANENWTKRWDGKEKEILIKQEYKEEDPENFIKGIKKYITDKRYIKIDDKPIIGLYEPNKIPNLKKTIKIWREKSREFRIGEIFILICINNNKTEDFQDMGLFNATYEFPPRNSFQNQRLENNKTYIYHYSEVLYKSLYFNESNVDLNKLLFFRGSMVEWDNCPRISQCAMFYNYSPEKFYIYNKIIVNWTKNHYYKTNIRFIFINAWNEWGEGSYLEPDDKYGYASINSLSKAIFNLSYVLNNKTFEGDRIAIIAQLSCEDSINEIRNKIDNIPYIFDLFLYNDKEINISTLKEDIKLNPNLFYCEFNKRENILDFLFHFKKKLRNYKYICIINYKQSKNIIYFEDWKNYIHNNLLGDSIIISEIIGDFEENNKLGIIFPEKYYKSPNQFQEYFNKTDLKYMNSILKKIKPRTSISDGFADIPEGNMFWAKVRAIYPIFNLYPYVLFTKKYKLILEYYLEKIWIYILNISGYFYRKIFKHF